MTWTCKPSCDMEGQKWDFTLNEFRVLEGTRGREDSFIRQGDLKFR